MCVGSLSWCSSFEGLLTAALQWRGKRGISRYSLVIPPRPQLWFQPHSWNTAAGALPQTPGADRTSAGLQTTLEAAPTAVCLPKVMPRPARRS